MEGTSLWFRHSHLQAPGEVTIHQHLTGHAEKHTAKEQGTAWQGASQEPSRGREMQLGG